MKKQILTVGTILALVLVIGAGPVFAHQHEAYKIGGKYYQFTIGSLNEPVAVDDKTGVELKVELLPGAPGVEKEEVAGTEDSDGTPVTGLETSLKVELGAGGQTKTLDLSPAYGLPGSYRASFTPTVQTTYTYRVFGRIDNIPVDIKFSCNPAGHVAEPESMETIKLSDQVSRVHKVGAFGCPASKADLGFPEKAPTLVELQTAVANASANAASAKTKGTLGLVFGVIALALGGKAIAKSRKPLA